jgi:hypothetical protein
MATTSYTVLNPTFSSAEPAGLFPTVSSIESSIWLIVIVFCIFLALRYYIRDTRKHLQKERLRYQRITEDIGNLPGGAGNVLAAWRSTAEAEPPSEVTSSTWWGGDPPKALPQAVAGCLTASAVAAATIAGGDGGAEVDGDDDEEKPATAIGGMTCNADDSSPASAQAESPTPATDTATVEEPARED